jgi:DNA-binding transcriptional MerR regulator
MRSPTGTVFMHDEALTRPAVAAALGVHVSTVRRLEQRGALRAVGTKGRWPTFRAEDVAALSAQASADGHGLNVSAMTEGQLTARAFELFRRGYSHEQVVIALEQPAPRIRDFFAQWRAGYRQPPAVRSTDAEEDVVQEDNRDVREWERAMKDLMKAHAQDEAVDAAERSARMARRQERRAGALASAAAPSRRMSKRK